MTSHAPSADGCPQSSSLDVLLPAESEEKQEITFRVWIKYYESISVIWPPGVGFRTGLTNGSKEDKSWQIKEKQLEFKMDKVTFLHPFKEIYH